MEPNKEVQALKVLQDEGREDLIKEGVLEEAWVGLRRPKRLSSGGVMAAVIACSSPQKKFKKCKNKSAEGRKVKRSPDLLQEVLPQASGLNEPIVVRGWGAGRCSQRSGVSLTRRVAAGGRGAGPCGVVAFMRLQGARRVEAHAPGSGCDRLFSKQDQSPRKSGVERNAAILEEGTLGGAIKMAATSEKVIPLTRTLEEGKLGASAKMAARSASVREDVIIISDEETEIQDKLRLVDDDNYLQSFGQLGGKVSRCVRGMRSLDSDVCQEVRDGNFGSQSVFKVGEQVEFVDQAGVVIRGVVCGQTSGDGSIGRTQVLMDFWQAGLDEGNPGCDAPRFSGGLSEVTMHREAGRPAGGQSVSVKVGAPLGHRHEGRVKSGAVYPTAREWVLSGSLGHSAGSVLDEQPSTSRGASARFESTEEEWLDYEEDGEEQVMPALKSVAKRATQSVPEVVRGDRSGNRQRDMAVGNFPRGEELGSANFGFGRQVGVGSGANFGTGSGGLLSRKGGVDVSFHVDSDSGTGADEASCQLKKPLINIKNPVKRNILWTISIKRHTATTEGGAWPAPDEAASVTQSSGAAIGARPAVSPCRAHRSICGPLGPSPVDPRHQSDPVPGRIAPAKASLGEYNGRPWEIFEKQDGGHGVCGGGWREDKGTEAQSSGGVRKLKAATRGASWEGC
ncbi:hypothetical protein NDU88_006660 [Pleurodeles waltl]|uniref:Uncharacterized protein n=1 Tax=Pleurodeles waltl TaxID=8319 RepID=A0AAV7PJD7_PLEWA|nr:hypothetical protein NDU88_006660 [Pleurodeles waltl]